MLSEHKRLRLVHGCILAQDHGLDSVARGAAGADRMGQVGPRTILKGAGH